MKKVIAVAAGLMLTGALVTTASAAVSFSGDARIRGYYETDYDFGRTVPLVEGQLFPRIRTNEEDIKANSRYRVKINADAKGGAYVRSRIRIGNGTHDTAAGGKTDVDTDYMFVGMPIGAVTVEGGRMPANVTKWFLWDRRYDMIIGKWANEMTALEFWYVKNEETSDPNNDDDITTYVGKLNQGFAGDWGLTVAAAYIDDQKTIEDRSGFVGTIGFNGPAGPVSLVGEFSYAESDVELTPDDGYGGYLEGGMDFGATSVTLLGGWAGQGFIADDDFGWIMLGGASSITPSGTSEFGAFAGVPVDTTFVGGTVGFKASEALSLTGILAYADFDDFGDGFEISGRAVYQVSDGANIQWDMGYLSWSMDNDILDNRSESPFGTALTLNVSF